MATPQRASAGGWLGLRTRLRRSRLDHRLAAGEPTWASPELHWRAAELTAPSERRAIADQIDGVIDAVAAPPRPRGAAVPLNRDGILGCHQLLQDLVDALRHAELVRPRGVAMLRRLLQDGGSLLYAPGNARALEVALSRARAALLVD